MRRVIGLFLWLGALGSFATADALPAHAYSDGGPLSLSEQDIEILERLAREEIQRDHEDSEEQEAVGGGDVNIDLAPPQPHPQHQQPPPQQKLEEGAAAVPVKKGAGQREFISLTDPDILPSARRHDVPVVEVKRRPAGENIFSDDDERDKFENFGDTMFVAVTTACSAAAIFGLVAAGFCWYKLHKQHEAAADAAYPQYGGTGPAIGKKKSPTQAGDASLAYSAQLHHFNQTKQKILSSEQGGGEGAGAESEESDGEHDDADFSVYECPGLAPTGDIEVANPLFDNASPKSKEAPGNVLED